MVYLVVLIGSASILAAILLSKLLLKQRAVRRFVRSIRQRLQSAEDRGAVMVEETVVERPQKDPRTSAIELQQVRSFLRLAEKALAQEKTEEAERLYIQALTIQPHAQDVKAQLAKLYLTSNREPKAEAMYRELLKERDEVSFHANLGLAYYRQGKYVDACFGQRN